MAGDTTFHFVSDLHEALGRARAAAGDLDIRIGGGASTVRQYLQAGAIDEVHLAISPVILGEGESLFAGLDLPKLGFKVTRSVQGEQATHVVLSRG
jgi:dihydrofolate reductase